MNNKLSLEQELEIIQLKNENILSNREILLKYNISIKTIYNIVKRNGIQLSNRKYNINENYFENIDNEYKAYWLGFLYADGMVRIIRNNSGELKLKLKYTEKYHIELFNKCLESNYPIKSETCFYKTKNKKKYLCKTEKVRITNIKIVNDLIKHGCMPAKTFKIKFPNLNNDLMKHFIRGYFDGDGCIHKLKNKNNEFQITICGNEQFIKSLQNYLSEKFNSDKIHNYKYKNIKLLIICNHIDCIKFKNYIYDNSSIYLERKKIIFDKLI